MTEFTFKDYVLWLWRNDVQRTRGYLAALTKDITEAELNWQAGPGAHSLWHHIWHMFLCTDYYVCGAFGVPATWDEGNWHSRIDLTNMARAFDYPGLANEFIPHFTICDVPDSLVDDLKAVPLDQYYAYVDAMLARCTAMLEKASEQDLAQEIPFVGRMVPRAQRASFGHPYRHIGMMEDIRGLIRGPGQGSASGPERRRS